MTEKRVLSIQSHVVSGYVGNRAAVFPLQLLGFDVDVINSVQYSNHSQYPNGKEGDVLKGDQLKALLTGLERNDLLSDTGYILTGYIGSASFLEALLDVIHKVRSASSHTVQYVCDPVLGDHGKFYVPPELVPLYRDLMLPVADVVTPNQFEVEQLTGIVVHTMEDALQACNALHDMGPPLVFITSIQFPSANSNSSDDGLNDADKHISIVASERVVGEENSARTTNVWTIECPIIMGHFTGTGDLTASLLLGHMASLQRDNNTSSIPSSTIPIILEKVVNTMFAVVQRTAEHAGTTIKSRELKLVASKDIIENPPQRFKATRVM